MRDESAGRPVDPTKSEKRRTQTMEHMAHSSSPASSEKQKNPLPQTMGLQGSFVFFGSKSKPGSNDWKPFYNGSGFAPVASFLTPAIHQKDEGSTLLLVGTFAVRGGLKSLPVLISPSLKHFGTSFCAVDNLKTRSKKFSFQSE